MIETPSIVTNKFGKGRVLLSSPHPEWSEPRNIYLMAEYIALIGGEKPVSPIKEKLEV